MSFITPGGLGQDFASGFSAFSPASVPSGVALSNNNLTATGTGTTNYGSVLGTRGQSSGKLYFEVTFNTQLSTNTGAGALAGLAPANFITANNYPGAGSSDWGVGSWFQVNQEIHLAAGTGNVGTPANGDVAMLAVDLTNGYIWFGVNGAWFNGVGPSGVVDFSYSVTKAVTLYPVGFVQHLLVCTLNVGRSAFRFAVPTGFSKWG